MATDTPNDIIGFACITRSCEIAEKTANFLLYVCVVCVRMVRACGAFNRHMAWLDKKGYTTMEGEAPGAECDVVFDMLVVMSAEARRPGQRSESQEAEGRRRLLEPIGI